MRIRPETADDHAAVKILVTRAFARPDKANLVAALRAAGDSALSLVAEQDGSCVGHIMLSALLSPARALTLAPVSVDPSHQGQGIGSALIETALATVRRHDADSGWQSVFVLGEPAYYARFDFEVALASRFTSPFPAAYMMAVELQPGALADVSGEIVYPPAFG